MGYPHLTRLFARPASVISRAESLKFMWGQLATRRRISDWEGRRPPPDSLRCRACGTEEENLMHVVVSCRAHEVVKARRRFYESCERTILRLTEGLPRPSAASLADKFRRALTLLDDGRIVSGLTRRPRLHSFLSDPYGSFYSGVRGLGCRLRLFCGVWRRKVLAAFPHGVCREALVAGLAGLPGCGRVRRLRRPLAAVRGRRALLVGSPAPATSPSPLPCPSGPPLHSPFGAPPFGAPGKLILPPWASGPCWGAAPHRLQLLPSGTYRPCVLLCMRLPRR